MEIFRFANEGKDCLRDNVVYEGYSTVTSRPLMWDFIAKGLYRSIRVILQLIHVNCNFEIKVQCTRIEKRKVQCTRIWLHRQSKYSLWAKNYSLQKKKNFMLGSIINTL